MQYIMYNAYATYSTIRNHRLFMFVELGIEDAEYIIADVNIQKSLNHMCIRSHVIINCVGPVSDLTLSCEVKVGIILSLNFG